MKLITWNVNGIRSVYKKGFLELAEKIGADIVCLQEIKADESKIPEDLVKMDGYFAYFNSAEKKGYAGTAVFTKIKPNKIIRKIGFERFDSEGRFLRLDFDDFILLNIYLPHGGRQKENLGYKLEAYDCLLKYLKRLKNKNVILAGDFNIAHSEIDLERPKSNKNNIMFTLEERAQLDRLEDLGFIDSFRKFNQEGGNYTWWPYMANARERNLGWRIDYVFVSASLRPKLKNAFILSDIFGSDHCPAGINPPSFGRRGLRGGFF